MDREKYGLLIQSIFNRFPSVQTSSFNDAYKPGLQHMLDFSTLLGNPHRQYRTVHVAGTNGKGSTANMLASVLAGAGLRTGLYTSPHILDFRERMRILDGRSGADKAELVPEEYVYTFLEKWSDTFDKMQLSFFEITTGLAFKWFADMDVDIAVIEVGLGGRLDSTNIITPELSIVTSIGLDHCDLLGDTLAKIAYEKAGIFKPGVPALAGETMPETEPVFRTRFSEVNADVHGNVTPALTFADKVEPTLWDRHREILAEMDLQGEYQSMNLRTVLAAVDILRRKWTDAELPSAEAAARLGETHEVEKALIRTAARMDFHGRWERLASNPDIICDIGHNPPALIHNFRQLNEYLESGRYTSLTMVYGIMADKDLDSIMPLFPERATWIFTTPHTRRADGAEDIRRRYEAFCRKTGRAVPQMQVQDSVKDAVALAMKEADGKGGHPLIYIGGSTFVVAEAVPAVAAATADKSAAEDRFVPEDKPATEDGSASEDNIHA